VVEGRPDLPDFARRDVKGVDAWQSDLPPACRATSIFSLVSPMHRGEAGSRVSIGDHYLDREMDSKGISQRTRRLDEVYWTVDTSGRTIEDEIGRQNLVCRRHVSPGNNLVKETTDKCIICS